MSTSVVSVGIDVGKAKLDVACMHQDKSMVHQVFSNNVKGIRSLRLFLKQQRTAPTVPCIESTGVYHLLVALSLNEAGYRVNCVNPIITKKYMKATVRDAKSDKIDAKRIAELGYHEPGLQRFTLTRESIAAKSILSALAQLETLRQQLSAHIAHTKEMRTLLGVAIDCRAAAKSLECIERQIAAHRARLCELVPEETHVLASHIKGLSLEQASVLLTALARRGAMRTKAFALLLETLCFSDGLVVIHDDGFAAAGTVRSIFNGHAQRGCDRIDKANAPDRGGSGRRPSTPSTKQCEDKNRPKPFPGVTDNAHPAEDLCFFRRLSERIAKQKIEPHRDAKHSGRGDAGDNQEHPAHGVRLALACGLKHGRRAKPRFI